MPLEIRHAFVSPISDDPGDLAAGKVTPSRWNAPLNATMATGRLLGRFASGNGPVEEVDPATLSIGWTQITGTPTTLAGYGITDAAPLSHVGSGGAAHANATTSVAGFMSAADKTKLNGIQDGATANSSDAFLLDRANHTGTQSFSTIVMGTGRLLGRTSSGSGATEEITPAASLSLSAGSLGIATNGVTDSLFRQSAGLSVVGRSANTTGNVADITAATDGHVLRRSGTSLGFGTLASGAFAANTIPVNSISMNSARILWRQASGAGSAEEISISAPLTFSGGSIGVQTFGASQAGVVPASGGGTTNFLRADGTWAAPPGGGGGGSPGGSSGQVQFNDSGAFGGASNVEIGNGLLRLISSASAPAAPASSSARLYLRPYASLQRVTVQTPEGVEYPLQRGFTGGSLFFVAPANGTTAPTTFGGALTTAATISHQQTFGSTSRWQATRRTRFQTSTTAGTTTGLRTAYAQWYRGNSAGFGGFYASIDFGQNINLNGGQTFVGLCASTAALGGDPSALVNMIGCGYDAADPDTGNWFLMRNDGSGTATKIDLGTGAARNTTHGFRLEIYCPHGVASEIFVRVTNLDTGTVVLNTSYTTDIPAVNTGLALKCECRNGSVAAAHNIEVASVYIEANY